MASESERTDTIPEPTEQLENGARATTPSGDNAQLDFIRADAAAFADLARSAGGRAVERHDLGLSMTDAHSPCPFGNVAHILRPLAAAETNAVATTLHDFYSGHEGGAFLVFSPWPTEDWTEHGYILAGHPPLMVRPPGPPPPSDTGLRIVEVTSPQLLAVFEQTLIEAYPTPELDPFGSAPRLFGEALMGSAWKLVLGFEGERAVATGGAFVADSMVGIEMISTRPDCRGRGYGAAITAAATAYAGDRPAMLIASDPGYNVYRALGYMPVLRYTLWVGQR
jgi:GNAT superfamily N-acetyltransferase